jgi:hypothetical protein
MKKRTHASVTTKRCRCDYLQNAADDPDNPIRFVPRTAEYQFAYGDSMLVIYHCPFCGGAAPESKRHMLFAQIPDAEDERLTELMDGLRTIEDVIGRLGKPDFEGLSTARHFECENQAPSIQHHRDIRYHRFSEVADIWITERPDGTIFWRLQGKYIGGQDRRNDDVPVHQPDPESD